MRRFPTTLLIVVLTVFGLIVGWKLFWPSESQRFQQVSAVRQQRSELHFSEVVTHAKGPIAREEWRRAHTGGGATASYSAQNRAGTRVAKFPEPIPGYDVTFSFEKL